MLFAWAFAVQAVVPAPAVPMLVGTGALSGSGRMHLALAVAAATAAALGADALWYSLGRTHGTRVLGILCRLSLDPDSLIRHVKERFAAHRVRYLIIAKFLPGVNPLAARLAGAIPIRPDHFLLYATAGGRVLCRTGACRAARAMIARRSSRPFARNSRAPLQPSTKPTP